MTLPVFSRLAGRLGLVLLFVLLSLLSAPDARAQSDDEEIPLVTHTYAIEGARIVQAPGQVVARGTVVIRDGLITAVGAIGEDAPIPFDARRIDGDSLVVYAGFIDGLSHTGVDMPAENEDEEEVENPGDPPYDRAGIQPDRAVRPLLDPSDSRVEQLREAGFAAAHVVPEGDMLPGSGAVILLAGDTPSAMVLKEDASLFMQFESAGGVYPATPMGVIATMRQLYHEAERRRTLEDRYAEAPRGTERPPDDPVHAALFPVLAGRTPLFIQTEDALEIYRALSLHEELGFSYALTGLHQAFDALDALQQTEAPLFLTLALPEEPDDEPEEETAAPDSVPAADSAKVITPEPPGTFFRRDLRTRTYEDLDEERENLLARRRLSLQQYYETAADLHEAGLTFGFTTAGADPGDLREHLRLMIENGLPEEAALAALTTDAAALLGLSERLGTVEEGKIANLVLTSGPYFDEDTDIRYVFVDGRMFEIEEEAEGEAGEAEPAGTWSYSVSSPQGDFDGTLTLTGEPGDLSGAITGPDGEEIEIENVQLDGADLSFEFDAGQMGAISAEATISGDEMEGTMTLADFGSFPFTATRTSEPEAR